MAVDWTAFLIMPMIAAAPPVISLPASPPARMLPNASNPKAVGYSIKIGVLIAFAYHLMPKDGTFGGLIEKPPLIEI